MQGKCFGLMIYDSDSPAINLTTHIFISGLQSEFCNKQKLLAKVVRATNNPLLVQPDKQPAGGAVTQVIGQIIPESLTWKNLATDFVESSLVVLTPTERHIYFLKYLLMHLMGN